MSDEVPTNVGELSRYALEQAIDKIDATLKDADQELRDAVSVVRLVTGMPRRAPWYGINIPSMYGADTVALGTVFGNLADDLEYCADADAVSAQNARRVAREEALRLRRLLERGKREYHDYLDHLFDPARWEREQAERRLRDEEAALIRAVVMAYREEKS